MSEMQTRDSSESSWYGDDDIAEVLYSPDLIQARVREIGQAITRDYADKAYEPTHDGSPAVLVISVLRGAAIYMSDLVRSINLPLEMDYMAVSSYGSGVKSSGIVRRHGHIVHLEGQVYRPDQIGHVDGGAAQHADDQHGRRSIARSRNRTGHHQGLC